MSSRAVPMANSPAASQGEARSVSRSKGMSRRTLFQLAGGGVIIFIGAGPLTALAQDGARIYPEDFNAYLVVRETGMVTVYSGKIEMGQGVMTSQAQMVAEELAVPLSSVQMVLGDTDQCPWDMGTFGSLTTRMFGPALRAAAAKARVALTTIAARTLGVRQESLVARDGVISVRGEPGRSVSYGDLSKGARIAEIVDERAALHAASDFQVMGKSAPRLDALEKVTGAAKYTADIRVPGLMYACILRPPMHGATLSSVDTSLAEKLPGITVIRDGALIAVLHAQPDAASAALARIDAQWVLPERKLDPATIFSHILSKATAQKILVNKGAPAQARKDATTLLEMSYEKGYVAHAPMEPHAAMAKFEDGKVTVWASTQTPFPTRDRIAQTLGLAQKQVRVITPFLGGGFGGKSADGQALEAARLAQLSGRPVQVAWSREEEFFFDRFDPAAVVRIASATGRDGKLMLWDYGVYAAGERGASPVYDIEHVSVRSFAGLSYDSTAGSSVHPFAVGPWRAPGANMNVFATESQIDIEALACGLDPLAFRRRNLTDPRMHAVLDAAAEEFGWNAGTAPSGRGFGLACSVDAGTYVATMAEVSVDAASGAVKVHRIVCAQDMGVVVNPLGARMQMEGGITMGLGYTLAEELNFFGGEIRDRSFHSYAIPRFSGAPPIRTVLVRNDSLAPQGGGEPAITTTGAVIANAVCHATGVRMTRLPMTPERIRKAIAAKGGRA